MQSASERKGIISSNRFGIELITKISFTKAKDLGGSRSWLVIENYELK